MKNMSNPTAADALPVSISDFNVQRIGDGIPLIFLHGYMLDHTCMKATFEPLFSGQPQHVSYTSSNSIHGGLSIERIYLDLPGMGASQNYQHIQNADDMIEALVQLITLLVGDKPFLLAGMSYGGYLARGVLRRLPHQVRGLLLFVPVVFPLHADRTLPSHEVLFEDTSFTQGLTDEQRTTLRAMNVVITERIFLRGAFEFDAAIARGDLAFLERYQAQGYEATYSVEDANGDFMAPVMILAGKQDSVVGYQDQYLLSRHFRHCTFLALDCAGHGLHLEQERLFAALVTQWLTSVERANWDTPQEITR